MMKTKLPSFIKNIFSPFEIKPIEVTSPPSDLPPVFVGLVLRKRLADTSFGMGEPPSHIDFFATLLSLANRGVIRIQEDESNKDFIIKILSSGEIFNFERILTGCISYEGNRKLTTLIKDMDKLADQFKKSIKEEAIQYGLFNYQVSRHNLTDTGMRESISWRDFYRFIEYAAFDKKLAEPKVDEWDSYLPYAAEFMLARAWIKMFADLNAPSPRWFETSDSINQTSESSRETFKSIKEPLIKLGNIVANIYFDW